MGSNVCFVRKYFCSITVAVPAVLMSVRHTDWTQHPANLEHKHYCERRCSGDQIEKNVMGGACSTCGRDEAYRRFWWRNLRLSNCLVDLGVDGGIILRWMFRKWNVELWTESSRPRIGTGGGHL